MFFGKIAAAQSYQTADDPLEHHYPAHHPLYWEAQRHGFAMIREVEDAIEHRNRNCYRMEGDEIVEQWDDVNGAALHVATAAARGHALLIVNAQQRNDEVAEMIRNCHEIPW